MADLVVSNEGERYLLGTTLRIPTIDPDPWHLHLFKNDYTPTRDVTLADLVEADFSGYAPIDLAPATWTAPVTIDGQAVSWYGNSAQTFTLSTGAQTVFGFYLTDQADAVLLWALRFDAPVIVTPGSPASVQPSLGGRSQSEPV